MTNGKQEELFSPEAAAPREGPKPPEPAQPRFRPVEPARTRAVRPEPREEGYRHGGVDLRNQRFAHYLLSRSADKVTGPQRGMRRVARNRIIVICVVALIALLGVAYRLGWL